MVVFLRRSRHWIKHFQFMSQKFLNQCIHLCKRWFVSALFQLFWNVYLLNVKQVSTGHELKPLCQVQQVDNAVFDWLDHKIYRE
jgi:hypothetical protein